MDKKALLIQLYTNKDRKRRRLLMELFADKLTMNVSIRFICQLINQELGQPDMIKNDDVVYCRFHFTKKQAVTPKVPAIPLPKALPKTKADANEGDIVWSDPDADDFKQQSTIQSKYTKQ